MLGTDAVSYLPFVLVPHTEDGLCPATRSEVQRQSEHAHFELTPKCNPFAYADVLREYWQLTGDLVIVEQDVIPPANGIRHLFDCPHEWCSGLVWYGNGYISTSLGFVKFKHSLRRRFPDLADIALAPPDPRYFTRRGWTAVPFDCSVAVLNDVGSFATLRTDLIGSVWPQDPHERPSTMDFLSVDTALFVALNKKGVFVHEHHEIASHLHDYGEHPVGSLVPWHQRPYDSREWPAR